MLLAAARRRVVAWRQPRSAARIARALWIAWAIVVWNVVFDRVIVVAGRQFIVAAAGQAAASPAGPFANMDSWMRPAVTRAALLATGLTAVNYAGRRSQRRADPLAPRRPPSAVPSATMERLAMPDKSR